MTTEKREELLTVKTVYNVAYHWSAGQYVGKFLEELRDNGKIFANLCPQCGRGLVPPRPWCARCNVRMGEWVELSGKASVLVYSVAEMSFWDPLRGQMTPIPSAGATLQMDGPPILLRHNLKETDPKKLRMGMRVKAVLRPKEQRIGSMTDIMYFETIEE